MPASTPTLQNASPNMSQYASSTSSMPRRSSTAFIATAALAHAAVDGGGRMDSDGPSSPLNEADAVTMDPTSLWAALDLPAPESLPSQHTARRVILLGRPLSGKRTVCRRLCFAAEAQYASAAGDKENDDDERGGAGGTADNGRQPLYHPSSSDEEDAELYPHQRVGGWNIPGAFSTVGALRERSAMGTHDHSAPFSHGSGVCFDYVVQRVPTRVMRSGVGGTDGASGALPRGEGLMAAQMSGTVRRTTEFFCCDSAGALSMALPSLEDLETAVVLIVVDVSDVSAIRQQLEFGYTTLNTYVANLLRTQAPNNDEVRRLQLAAAQQEFWYAEEQKLRTTRTNLATSVASSTVRDGASSPRSDVLFKDPSANLEKVNSSAFRVPSSANTVCPMRTMIMCTKADQLERVSRTVEVVDSAGGGSGDSDLMLNRLGVPSDMLVALRRSRQSLLSLVAQLLRHYAIYHRAALASVGQRVNMTTAGADGEYAGTSLVNPFYKGLWAYIGYVLYAGKDPNASLPSDVLRVCSARMHPHTLLPCGLDAPGLLSPFVAAENLQLPETPTTTSMEEAMDVAIRTTAENVLTPDGVFPLHQRYIQLSQGDGGTYWARPEEAAFNNEGGSGLVWDSM